MQGPLTKMSERWIKQLEINLFECRGSIYFPNLSKYLTNFNTALAILHMADHDQGY